MKPRLSTIVAALCLSLTMTGASSGSAEAPNPLDPDWLSRMLAEGWRQVQDGVLERRPEEGRVETFTYGPEGRRYMIQRLRERLAALKREQRSCPAADLRKVIADFERDIERAEAFASADRAGVAGSSEPTSAPSAKCGPGYGADATAGPLPSAEGPGATASAYAGFAGCAMANAYSYAYARATAGTRTTTMIQEEPWYDHFAIDTFADARASGSLDCFSEAYARTWAEMLDINLEVSDVNFQCVP
jgi:hypothetical protein